MQKQIPHIYNFTQTKQDELTTNLVWKMAGWHLEGIAAQHLSFVSSKLKEDLALCIFLIEICG